MEDTTIATIFIIFIIANTIFWPIIYPMLENSKRNKSENEFQKELEIKKAKEKEQNDEEEILKAEKERHAKEEELKQEKLNETKDYFTQKREKEREEFINYKANDFNGLIVYHKEFGKGEIIKYRSDDKAAIIKFKYSIRYIDIADEIVKGKMHTRPKYDEMMMKWSKNSLKNRKGLSKAQRSIKKNSNDKIQKHEDIYPIGFECNCPSNGVITPDGRHISMEQWIQERDEGH